MTTKIPVTGFALRDLTPGQGTPPVLSLGSSADWLPALVPGGVHESLVAAGRATDPRIGDHEPDVAWVEGREWWFRTRVTTPAHAPGDRVRLVFGGLDTIADVWLGGVPLGHHENQFRPAVFDVTGHLRPGESTELLVCFAPPLPAGEPQTGIGPRGPMRLVTGLRKAGFSWGWDFAPRLPSIGLWRPVWLSVEHRAVLTGHHVGLTTLTDDHSHATVRLRAEVDAFAAAAAVVIFTLTTPGGSTLRREVPVTDGVAEVEAGLDDPVLWWTHDLGDPSLHEVRVELTVDGVPVDAVEDRVGLRTIALDRGVDPVEDGRFFRFVLNGVPLFALGAAWVPPSPFVGTSDGDALRESVRRAREGNLSMLRVWGGGVYEHDDFYAACDEQGVLVWQDFMFACADYPGDSPEFRAEVAAEARAQVSRLRNRACLALWCGNNEVEVINLIANGGREGGEWGRRIFHEVLPDAVAGHDGLVPYWPGSPWGEAGLLGVNSTQDGDRHDWEVWHGLVVPGFTTGSGTYPTPGDARHYRRYADDTGRFVSEFGILSAPDRGTLDRWLPGAALHDTTFTRHLTDRPAHKGDELLAVTTGVPADLAEYVALTQAVQAEGLAFAIEHFRRRQPHTAGALVWQFNDTWAAMSWSLVDVDGVPKAAYYAVARVSAPLVVSLRPAGDDGLELWLVNNTRETASVAIDVELGRFDGGERRTEQVIGTTAPGTSAIVWTGHVRQDAAHYAWASSPDGSFPPARRHFAELGELELGNGRVEAVVVEGGLELRARGYCYGVRVAHPVPSMRFDDNCFDLRDGERRFVRVTGADPAALTVGATVPRARTGMSRKVTPA